MEFQKKQWKFEDIISENELNRMEDGIEEGITKAEQAGQVAEQAKQTADAAATAAANAQSDIDAHKAETAAQDAHPGLAELWGARIVEMGSNANGTYVRWENGLQVCFGRVISPSAPLAGQWNFTPVTFPTTFKDTNYICIAGYDGFPTVNHSGWQKMCTEQYTTTSFRIAEAVSINGISPQPYRWIAIGRWK